MLDLASVAGVLLGLFAVFGGGVMEGIHVMSLIQFTAFLIVVGGSIGAMLLSTPNYTLKLGVKLTKEIFIFDGNQTKVLAERVFQYAEQARRESVFALEKAVLSEPNPFMKKLMRWVADGHSPEVISEVMETEIHLLEEKENNAGKMYETCGGYAPTIGIIGAVLGLIHVMNGLAAGAGTNELGKGIAVAFVATIYGVGSANLVFIPFGNKLKTRATYNKNMRKMMLDGFLCIVQGYNPRIIKEKLRCYYEEDGDAPEADSGSSDKGGKE